MEIQLTLAAIISGIALVAAIISPMLTTLIKNKHETKMYMAKFYIHHRAEVIERYVSSVGAVIHGQLTEDLREYGKHAGEIYVYVPERLWLTIEQIDLAIRALDCEAAAGHFRVLCVELSKEKPRAVHANSNGKKKQRIK